jgi:hypothetical protein
MPCLAQLVAYLIKTWPNVPVLFPLMNSSVSFN